jgi:hypothetical protein
MIKILRYILFFLYVVASIVVIPLCIIGDITCRYTTEGATAYWIYLAELILPESL